MKYFLIFLALIMLSSISCSQVRMISDFKLSKASKRCLILSKGGINLDTLCLISYKVRNQIIEVSNGKIITGEFRSGAIDNLDDIFYSIEEWAIEDDKFLSQNYIKITFKDCQRKRLRFNLTKNGIKWVYRSGFLKKERGIIPFIKLKEMDDYNLPCKR